ncbi:hypothetical protein GQ43DRAFT_199531 [Delitschia confertaspora ATCC 74209]|uniref:Uncharacterized protein n=1 Tax=Delitschia confertaspora ATCC 74209 TaxID=1513339 RepID=A0A9P4JED8_9PLEO|nr:hypothetical protein GQ43DRAFT_199531 [Delitschia confertaspora ATCC 74209]
MKLTTPSPAHTASTFWHHPRALTLAARLSTLLLPSSFLTNLQLSFLQHTKASTATTCSRYQTSPAPHYILLSYRRNRNSIKLEGAVRFDPIFYYTPPVEVHGTRRICDQLKVDKLSKQVSC